MRGRKRRVIILADGKVVKLAAAGHADKLLINPQVFFAAFKPVAQLCLFHVALQSLHFECFCRRKLALVLFVEQLAVGEDAGTDAAVIGRLNAALAGTRRAHDGRKGVELDRQRCFELIEVLDAFLKLLLCVVMCTRGDETAINQAVRADYSGVGSGGLRLQPFPDALGITVFIVRRDIFFRRQDDVAVRCLHCLLYVGSADGAVIERYIDNVQAFGLDCSWQQAGQCADCSCDIFELGHS